jgi:hypothetical protein
VHLAAQVRLAERQPAVIWRTLRDPEGFRAVSSESAPTTPSGTPSTAKVAPGAPSTSSSVPD